MITENDLFEKIETIRVALGKRGNTKKGYAVVAIISSELKALGYNPSAENVYLDGLDYLESGRSVQLDILLLKANIDGRDRKRFSPDELVAVFELKMSGPFNANDSKKTHENLKWIFSSIKVLNSKIHCLYITVFESENYAHRIRSELIGCPAYTLGYRKTWQPHERIRPTGDWQRIINDLTTSIPV